MRLYVALSLLEESEWANGTGCAACADPLELFLRRFLRGEKSTRNNLFGGHVSLYFEDAEPSMISKNAPFAQPDAANAKNFSVDILNDGNHSVNLVQSGACGWYARWSYGIVRLYRVLNLTDGDIRNVHGTAISLMKRQYTSIPNFMSLLPGAPWALWCVCCCLACHSPNSTNCVGAVEIALETGLRRPLGISKRFITGARLPTELVDELQLAKIVKFEREIVLVNTQADRERPCVTGLRISTVPEDLTTGLPFLPLNAIDRS